MSSSHASTITTAMTTSFSEETSVAQWGENATTTNPDWCLSSHYCNAADGCGQITVVPTAWVGVALFGFVVVFSLYRFIAASCGRSNTRTKIFYVLVVLCSMCEIVSQISLGLCGAPTHYSFPFHLFSEQLLLVSFSIIVAMWSAIMCHRNRGCVMWSFVCLNGIGIAFTIYVAIVCFTTNMPFFRGDFCNASMPFDFNACSYNIQAMYLVNSQFLLTVAIVGSGFFYCHAAQRRKQSFDYGRFDAARRRTCASLCDDGRDGTATRLFSAIVVCALCFMLRVCMEITTYAEGRSKDAWISDQLWYILAYWMPTAPPCVCMLFVMRLQKQYKRAAAQRLLEDDAGRSLSACDSESGIGQYFSSHLYRNRDDSMSSTGTMSTITTRGSYYNNDSEMGEVP